MYLHAHLNNSGNLCFHGEKNKRGTWDMTENVELMVTEHNGSESVIQIPIKRKDFGDFITNLLGQPESIEYRKVGQFDVDFSWLIHVHHLLNQRISQQQHASLVDFSALIKYRNSPDRKINSIESFLHFSEAKRVVTKSIRLTWTYLVSFPNKPSPEKQEVSIFISTHNPAVTVLGGSPLTRQEINAGGMIILRIFHTERTWGDDIESILVREIDSVFEKERWYSSAVEYVLTFLVLGLFVSGLVVPDYIEDLIRQSEVANILAESALHGGFDGVSDAEKLNVIIKLLDPGYQIHRFGIWFRIISFGIGIFLAVMFARIFFQEAPSFLLLTDEDKRRKERLKEKSGKSLLKKLLQFVFAIVTGVIGNYVYYYMSIS